MLKAHKIALDLNNKQKTYMSKAAGCARFAYNWALCEWQNMYKIWKDDNSQPKPNQYILRKKLNAIKREQFPWMLEVTKCAVQEAIIDLGNAFDRFFKHLAKYPKKHKKGIHDSFTISSGQFEVKNKKLKIPKLGWVRMTELTRFNGIIKSVTISRTADRWFASLLIDTIPPAENQGEMGVSPGEETPCGVDLGLKDAITLSDGTKIDSPKPLKRLEKTLRRAQKSLHRKVKGSKNRRKAREKLAKLYAKIANIRNDFLHKITTWLAKTYSLIGIENLNISGMLKNRHLAKAVSDIGFHEFKRLLEYKCREYGSKLVIADQWFPSSKTCSHCGHKLEKLDLSVRAWTCPECGVKHDRDVNAAINLMNLAVSYTVTACGEGSSGPQDILAGETTLCEAGT